MDHQGLESPSSIVDELESQLSRGPTIDRCLKDYTCAKMGAKTSRGATPSTKNETKDAAKNGKNGLKASFAQLDAATLEATAGSVALCRGSSASSTGSSTGDTDDIGEVRMHADAQKAAKHLPTATPTRAGFTTDKQAGCASKLDHPSVEGGSKTPTSKTPTD